MRWEKRNAGPAAPLPRTRFSYFSPLDILELLGKTICGRSVPVFRNLLVRFLYFWEINRRTRDKIDVVDEDVQCDVGDRLDQFAIGQSAALARRRSESPTSPRCTMIVLASFRTASVRGSEEQARIASAISSRERPAFSPINALAPRQ